MRVYGRARDGSTASRGIERFGQAIFPEQAHDQRLTVICERRLAQQDVAREAQLKVAAVHDMRQRETVRAA